jgi:hypothetical protein
MFADCLSQRDAIGKPEHHLRSNCPALRITVAANIINGGNGDDELTGLGGQDAFLFNTALDAAAHVDVIADSW